MDKQLLLYNYFSNQLTVEQERLFEDLLQTDTEFKQQFDFEKDLKQVIRSKETSNLKSKLVGFEKDLSKDTPVRTLPHANYRKWAMAASIALLIGLGWLGYNNLAGPNYGNLYDENFQQYPNTVYEITRGESQASIERDAFTAYELGEYQSAIDNFSKIETADGKEYIDFYLGLSHLNLGQASEAKSFFDKTIASNSEFVAEAYWYSALAAIKKGEEEEALQYLKILVLKFNYNKEKALELIEALQ